MRTVVLILSMAVFAVGSAHGQDLYDFVDGELVADKVVEAPGMSKDVLYIKMQQWFGESFKHPSEVIKFASQESGIIRGTYISSYTNMLNQVPFYHNITIEVKDEKYRITVDNIVNHAGYTMTQFVYKKNGEKKKASSRMQSELQGHLAATYDNVAKVVSKKSDW